MPAKDACADPLPSSLAPRKPAGDSVSADQSATLPLKFYR
jgi:hypothetical protein